MTEPIYKRQPILVGCLGCLSLSVVAMCGAGIFMGLLGKSCVDNVGKQIGLDSLPGAVIDSMGAGFSMQINEAEITMEPTSPRRVTCDDLQAVVFPHLTGTLATVTIESKSHEAGPDGAIQSVPLTCRWSGFPNKETPMGSGVVAPSTPFPSTPSSPSTPPPSPPGSALPPASGE